MKLSIVIVSWNCLEFLHTCLQSILNSDFHEKYEIIVVDNQSADGSAAHIRQYFPRVRLIDNRENVGFARASNQAIRAVTGEFVLLLNPDTVVEPDSLRVMVDFMEKEPRCGVAGCRVLNPDGTLQPACRRKIPGPLDALYKISGLSRMFKNSPRFSRYNMSFTPVDQVTEVDAVSGAFLMTSREVIDQIGILDERFFMYGEDLDWCLRAKQAGYRNYYVPHTSIVHFHGISSKKRPFRSTINFYRAMRVFYGKHSRFNPAKPFVYAGIYFCMAVALFLVLAERGKAAVFANKIERNRQTAGAGYQQKIESLHQSGRKPT